VIAWGVSLERPTMKIYDIPNIRSLFGEKLDLCTTMRENPVCWIKERPIEEVEQL
jgi:hypothetical protein